MIQGSVRLRPYKWNGLARFFSSMDPNGQAAVLKAGARNPEIYKWRTLSSSPGDFSPKGQLVSLELEQLGARCP